MTHHPAFIAGALSAGYLIIAAFFMRFWRRTEDRLFLAFAFAFALMAANQAGPALLSVSDENAGGFYVLRLIAFLAIAAAIVAKNLERRR